MTKDGRLISPRSTTTIDLGNSYGMRVVDMPEFYGGGYELSTGRRAVAAGKYGKSPWAFACMQIRGSELANLPWHLIDREGKIIQSHRLIDMFIEFGRESNYEETMQATEIDLLLEGKAFWVRDVDILQRLNPHSIELVKTADGISGFIQKDELGKIINRFARDEVVYFREFNPDFDLDPGLPIMEVIKKAVALEWEAGLYAEAFFKNDATPSMLLTSEQPISQQAMDENIAWWKKTFGGSRKKHKVGFVDKGLKAQVLSTSMKDIALTEIRTRAQNDICAGMRVPKILVGAMEEATYANAQEARKYMLEDVIIPRAAYFAATINADLIRKVDPDVRFKFFPNELPILQEGLNERWQRVSDAIEKRVITPEFGRQLMGWPETAAPTEQLPPQEAAARSWSRKAKKALRAGQSADVPFETDDIPQRLHAAIRARLSQATTAAEVDRAFQDA